MYIFVGIHNSFWLQGFSNSDFTSDVSILNSLFVESLDLLVFASEDNNICKQSDFNWLLPSVCIVDKGICMHSSLSNV